MKFIVAVFNAIPACPFFILRSVMGPARSALRTTSVRPRAPRASGTPRSEASPDCGVPDAHGAFVLAARSNRALCVRSLPARKCRRSRRPHASPAANIRSHRTMRSCSSSSSSSGVARCRRSRTTKFRQGSHDLPTRIVREFPQAATKFQRCGNLWEHFYGFSSHLGLCQGEMSVATWHP